MEHFLNKFNAIDNPSDYYTERKEGYKILNLRDDAWRGNGGRDISISHQTNIDCVFWSSEFPGCGNGDYYIVANEKEVIFLERD